MSVTSRPKSGRRGEREALHLLTEPDTPPVWSVAGVGRQIEYFDLAVVVRPLVNAGLLHRIGDDFVVTTPAAYKHAPSATPQRGRGA